MATVIQLESATMDALDQAVSSGRFSSHDEAIRTALQIVKDVDAVAADELTDDDVAAIEQGLADAEAGRTIPAEQVFAELGHRYQNWR